MSFLKKLAIVFASTYVLIFMSEHVFWSKPGNGYGSILQQVNPLTWISYYLATYSFLCIVHFFRVRDIWSMFLAGALFGWLIEGVVVSTTYDQLPTSICVTGLSWHSLLSICVMWYLLRRALIDKGYVKAAFLSTALGVFWATWGVWWWSNAEESWVAPLDLWIPYTFILSGALMVAYWILSKVAAESFKPTRAEIFVLALLNIGWFCWQVVPQKPIALAILPPLFLVTYLPLKWNRQVEPAANAIVALQAPISPLNYLMLGLMPATASITYALFVALGRHVRTGPPIFLTQGLVGFAMYATAYIIIFVRKARSTSTCVALEQERP